MNSHANHTRSKGCTTRILHKVMDVLLKGMAEGQVGKDCCLKYVPLKLCGRWFLLKIMCPLRFVIKDSNQLCCCVNGHHSSICCHHRLYDCLFDDLDNPEVECSFLLPQLSMMHIAMDVIMRLFMRVFMSYQFIKLTNFSTAFRWAKIPTGYSCMPLLM